MGSWKNWWCHSTAWQRENPGGPWISFSCPGHNMQDLQTSKAETFTLDIPRELTVRLHVRLLWKRENYTEVMKVHRNWRNNGQIPLVNLMHGKGPIYVELHCTVMARRAPLLFAQIFLSLKTYFITIKNANLWKNPCKKTMHILTGVSAPSAIYF